jgi:hypothetical protein
MRRAPFHSTPRCTPAHVSCPRVRRRRPKLADQSDPSRGQGKREWSGRRGDYRAALDQLGERLLDANRTIGQPDKITTIFGRRITKLHCGRLQTEIENLNLSSPVIRSHYRNGSVKQYVLDHLILRIEPATNDVTDYGAKKAVTNLADLRSRLSAIADNYLNVPGIAV